MAKALDQEKMGEGVAMVAGRRVELREARSSCSRGEAHEIRNSGRGSLRTLNVYAPPAYAAAGEA